jgi:hypothetical protein
MVLEKKTWLYVGFKVMQTTWTEIRFTVFNLILNFKEKSTNSYTLASSSNITEPLYEA